MTTRAVRKLEKQATSLGLRIVRADGPDTDLFVISRNTGQKLTVASAEAASAYLDGYASGQASQWKVE